MEGIRHHEGLDSVPKPCNFFDFTGGTSTDGYATRLISILAPLISHQVNCNHAWEIGYDR
jgi:hypothetical protein